MNNWNGLDFFVFLILIANLILGMARGATKEIISMLCLSVGLIFTIKFTVPLTHFMNSSPIIQSVITTPMLQNFMAAIGIGPLTVSMLNQVNYCLSLLICFAGAFCACEALLGFTGLVEVFPFPYAFINRKLGGALGFVRGYVFSLILFIVLMHLSLQLLTNGSFFFNLFQGPANQLDAYIASGQPEFYKKVLDERPYQATDLLKNLPSTDPTKITP